MLINIDRNLAGVAKMCANSTHSRFGATTGIQVWDDGDIYRVQATDGRRALIVQASVDDELPDLPHDGKTHCIVDPKTWEKAMKLGLPTSRYEKTLPLYLRTDDNKVYFHCGDNTLSERQVDGRFPDIMQVIPKYRVLAQRKFDAELLYQTLQVIKGITQEGDTTPCVDMLIYDNSQAPVGLVARNHGTGQIIDAMVVPLVPTEYKPEPPKVAEEKEEVEEEKLSAIETTALDIIEKWCADNDGECDFSLDRSYIGIYLPSLKKIHDEHNLELRWAEGNSEERSQVIAKARAWIDEPMERCYCDDCREEAEQQYGDNLRVPCSDCESTDNTQSTPCGTRCLDCMKKHAKECVICRQEFTEQGILLAESASDTEPAIYEEGIEGPADEVPQGCI